MVSEEAGAVGVPEFPQAIRIKWVTIREVNCEFLHWWLESYSIPWFSLKHDKGISIIPDP